MYLAPVAMKLFVTNVRLLWYQSKEFEHSPPSSKLLRAPYFHHLKCKRNAIFASAERALPPTARLPLSPASMTLPHLIDANVPLAQRHRGSAEKESRSTIAFAARSMMASEYSSGWYSG